MIDPTNQPTTQPTPDPISDSTMTAKDRADVIAGLKAMAQFLEDNPEMPCPQYIREQHTFMEPLNLRTFERVPVPDSEKIAFVRTVAARLGVDAEVDDESATCDYAVTARTTYTVHAKLRGGEWA